jgi:hypothetical protein
MKSVNPTIIRVNLTSTLKSDTGTKDSLRICYLKSGKILMRDMIRAGYSKSYDVSSDVSSQGGIERRFERPKGRENRCGLWSKEVHLDDIIDVFGFREGEYFGT